MRHVLPGLFAQKVHLYLRWNVVRGDTVLVVMSLASLALQARSPMLLVQQHAAPAYQVSTVRRVQLVRSVASQATSALLALRRPLRYLVPLVASATRLGLLSLPIVALASQASTVQTMQQ